MRSKLLPSLTEMESSNQSMIWHIVHQVSQRCILCSYSLDGTQIIVTAGQKVNVYDTNDGEPIQSLKGMNAYLGRNYQQLFG